MLYSVDYACWLFSWFHSVIFKQFHFFNSFNYVVSQRKQSFSFNFLPILLRFELLSFAILIIFYPNRCFGPSGRTSKVFGQIKGGKFTISICSVPTEHFISPSVWLCHYTNLPVFQLFWPPWLQSSLHLWLTNACCPCPRWRALTTQWRNTSSWWRRQKNALRDWMPKVRLVSWLLKLTGLTSLCCRWRLDPSQGGADCLVILRLEGEQAPRPGRPPVRRRRRQESGEREWSSPRGE